MARPFYLDGLHPDERQLLEQAGSDLQLVEEIALLRARAARLARITSPSPSGPENAQLLKTLQLLARLVGIQSRIAPLDSGLAALNDRIRQRLFERPGDVASVPALGPENPPSPLRERAG